MIPVNTDPSRRELRLFAGLWLPLFCAIVGGIVIRLGGPFAAAAILWGVAVAVGVTGLLRPESVRPVFVGWSRAAWPVGWVVSHALLLVIFFLVVTPMGLVLRGLGRDPLHRRIDRAAPTYWRPKGEDPPASRYFRQF